MIYIALMKKQMTMLSWTSFRFSLPLELKKQLVSFPSWFQHVFELKVSKFWDRLDLKLPGLEYGRYVFLRIPAHVLFHSFTILIGACCRILSNWRLQPHEATGHKYNVYAKYCHEARRFLCEFNKV